MKKIISLLLLLFINITFIFSQINVYTGISLGSFYDNKYNSETKSKVLLLVGLGFDQQLFKSSIGITSRIMYTQLGGKLDDIHEYTTNYSANCIAGSFGLKFRNNFRTKANYNISLSPTIIYIQKLNARMDFKSSDRLDLNLALDPDHPNARRWNYGINFDAGIDFKIKEVKIGISLFYTLYLEDMGGSLQYAFGGGYEDNKFYLENKGLRLSYFF